MKKVSVCITTYNHEKYIAQAIESVLMQKTDFDFEIIIGEDDSSDRTREIVTAFKKRYPTKIRLYLNSRENVIYVDGRPTGRWNFVSNLSHAEGEYIALLEGDDYWTSPEKLQLQVNYLDNHPECVLCFHDVMVEREGNYLEPWSYVPDRKERFLLEDLLIGNFIPTGSVLYRNRLVNGFPDWYFRTPLGDWPLFVLIAKCGWIAYLNRMMGVYRVHETGIWSSRCRLDILESTVVTADQLGSVLDQQQRQKLKISVLGWLVEIISILDRQGNYPKASYYAKQVMSRQGLIGLIGKVSVPYLFYIFLIGSFPQAHLILNGLSGLRSHFPKPLQD